ncbi:hypothetical protein [Stigmatella aurantiaca]|uniref:Lipoprotein n=1 Tax=Stigmatella aurantiaca (strain DW4/3-1) TaxID=378806 RepID=Q08XH9_STIAD|nr:hypothetical protein [Stigmatella aurantiaca]ADO72779.1 uncharacterized protein STAUR_5001 [Stigmatella aurantiaca DW4/3-1]EAU65187.1 hypothetical protein STIAU_1166 [Stigmatella aurantiaca DW4/3-1]
MKPLPLFALCLVLSGCQCGMDVPVPVTLRIRNETSQAIFVDATDDTLGLRVQRRVRGQWYAFVEAPPCECLACDSICGGCTCSVPPRPSRVRKLLPRTSIERSWEGFVQVDQTAPCRSGSGEIQGCLETEVPSVDETFRLEFCYAVSVPFAGPTDGSTPVPGTLPEDAQECVRQEFTPADGVVEVRPLPPPPCTEGSECTSSGTLCLGGFCTATCPAHAFPSLGGAWQVRVLEPEEQGVSGFFDVRVGTDGRRRFTGAGTLTSVRYAQETLTLQLARPASPAGEHKASLSLALPAEAVLPLQAGEGLTVHVVDASTSMLPEKRALTLRDTAGNLLLAADPGQLGAVLSAEETAPFSVVLLPASVGCEDTPCGKRVFRRTEFRWGASAWALEPGEGKDLAGAKATWYALNLANSEYRSDACPLKSVMPYVLVQRRGE